MNRALEFLNEAYSLLGYPNAGNTEKARLLVRLAIGEVEELADHGDGDGRGVLIVEAQRMTPARLTESPRLATALEWRRAALPGNGGL